MKNKNWIKNLNLNSVQNEIFAIKLWQVVINPINLPNAKPLNGESSFEQPTQKSKRCSFLFLMLVGLPITNCASRSNSKRSILCHGSIFEADLMCETKMVAYRWLVAFAWQCSSTFFDTRHTIFTLLTRYGSSRHFLFPKLATTMKRERFTNVEASERNVAKALKTISEEEFSSSFQQLHELSKISTERKGCYIEN